MSLLTTRIHKLLATAVGTAVLSFVPAMASARPHFGELGIGVVVEPQRQVEPCVQPCAPVVVDHVDRVWVEPVYRTVTERAWVAPVVEDRDVHTWVPDRYELQDVVVRERHHHYVTQENVLVEPAHDVCERQQVVITPGHWEDVQRQEVVVPGHFEDRCAPVVVEHRPEARIDILGGWLHLR